MNVAPEEIRILCAAASASGDHAMVRCCDEALAGDEAALRNVATALATRPTAVCPVCSSSSRTVRELAPDVGPVGSLLDATCGGCGWHYTLRRVLP